MPIIYLPHMMLELSVDHSLRGDQALFEARPLIFRILLTAGLAFSRQRQLRFQLQQHKSKHHAYL